MSAIVSMSTKKEKDTEALRDLFYSKRAGSSFDKLWRKVKKEGLDFTQKEVRDFLSRQESAQVTKEFKKPKKFTWLAHPHHWIHAPQDTRCAG